MMAGKAPFTVEELMLLPSGYARYELIHGELVQSPLSGGRHGLVLTADLLQLMTYVEPRNRLMTASLMAIWSSCRS